MVFTILRVLFPHFTCKNVLYIVFISLFGVNMDRKIIDAIEKLKDVKRKGWVEAGVKAPESVADHTCSVALIVLFSAIRQEGIDLERALTMALIHDLAESAVGDITPADRVPRRVKQKKERKAFESLLAPLEEDWQKELLMLWEELVEGKTPEARLVLDADIFERTVQAKIYKDRGEDVDRFFKALKELKGTDFHALAKDYFK